MAIKKVVLFGKGDLAIRIADYLVTSDKYSLDLVCPSYPEPTWTSSLSEWSVNMGIPWIENGNLDALLEGEWDLGISVFFNQVFKLSHINRFEKLVNIHNSPLPKYRGANPINWALKNNETKHGVTIHKIDEGVDTGEILGQVVFDIDPDLDEVEDVYRRSLRFGFTLFEDLAERFFEVKERMQDESLASRYFRADVVNLQERRDFRRESSN
jgi:methionyl-tRNA formyltransferase